VARREVQGVWEGTTEVVADRGGRLDADTAPTAPISHIPSFGFGSPKVMKKGDLRPSDKGSQIVIGSSDIDGHEGMKDVLRGCKRVAVIGIHGWFPGVFSFFRICGYIEDQVFTLRGHVTDGRWRSLFFSLLLLYLPQHFFYSANGDQHQVCQYDGTSFTAFRG
jgi:hypothetical protein